MTRTLWLLLHGRGISGGADNVEANPGTGGATFATDDDGTAHHPYTKMEWGADNTQTKVDVGAAAVPIQDGGNTITVDGTVAVTNAGLTALNGAISGTEVQIDVVGALPAGNNNIGDVDVASVTGNVTVIQGTATNLKAQVIGAGSAGTADAGVLTVQGIASMTPVQVSQATATNLNAVVIGSVAHDTGTPGAPVTVAGTAQNMDDTAPPNRVSAESDVTRIATDRDGAVFVRNFGPQIWTKHLDGSSAYTDESIHAAPGSGLCLYVTDIVVSTGAATALNVFFEEGSTKVLGPYYLEAVAGRGLALHFVTPKKITADTALTVTTSANIAQAIDVQGFVAQG